MRSEGDRVYGIWYMVYGIGYNVPENTCLPAGAPITIGSQEGVLIVDC